MQICTVTIIFMPLLILYTFYIKICSYLFLTILFFKTNIVVNIVKTIKIFEIPDI